MIVSICWNANGAIGTINTMTTADEQLRQYLANGEMAKHNEELLRPSRHPALKADPVVKNGQPVACQSRQNEAQTGDKRSSLEILMQDVIDTALTQFPHLDKPQTEYRFHKTRQWRFDFAWPNYTVAVEVEGGQWVNGRHQRGKGFEDDCEKYNEAVLDGWRVLRFTGDMVKDGRALAVMIGAFEELT